MFGLGNTRTFRELKDILQKHMPKILFLCEMKLMFGQIMNMGKRLGFDNCMAISRNGMGGGLALLWNDDLELEIVA